jgi:ferric-dicitrate binding protein FerR (iron transport regulator)
MVIIPKMSQDQFWNLLAKKLSGEASEEELKELESLMKAYPDLLFAAQHIESLWNLKTQNPSSGTEEDFKKHITRTTMQGIDMPYINLEDEPAKAKEKPWIKKWQVSLAAIGCIAFVLCIIIIYKIGFRNDKDLSEERYSEVSTRAGSKSKLLLPDSTIVWLNAGSKLTYNEHFGVKNRDVTLNGEAYFDVKKSHIPFIIHAKGIQIKVLGTAFNVRSYPNDATTETSLIRGKVEITLDKHPEEKYILRPDQKLIVNNISAENSGKDKPLKGHTPLIVLEQLNHIKDSIIAETSWIENKLIFQDEAFGEVAKKMERWYGVIILFNNKQLEESRFTGVFEKESVSQALEAIQFSTPFHFSIKKDSIFITK